MSVSGCSKFPEFIDGEFSPQMRRMYGLFTYMKGEKWPHEQEKQV